MAFPTITEKTGYMDHGPRRPEFMIPLPPLHFEPMGEPEEPQLDSALEDEVWLEARKFLDNRET